MLRPDKNQKGIALMLVLWIMILMLALAAEFASSMHTEVRTTTNYKEDIESYHLARAGINLAMAELLKVAKYHSHSEETGFMIGKADKAAEGGEAEPKTNAAPEEETGDETDYYIVNREDIPLGSGSFSYAITDENGKININTVQRDVLIKALGAAGLEIGEERDIIADSILDWIDTDDNHRLNGAETQYYKTLDPPYAAKNRPLDSLEELLRVRGVTEEILFGTAAVEGEELGEENYIGLDKIFTVQNVKKFNPNTASPESLRVFYNEEQLEKLLADKGEKNRINDSLSTHFRVTSTGSIDGSKTKHTVVAIFEKLGTDAKATLLTRYWNDNHLEP